MSDALDTTLAALADPVRRAIVDLLGRQPRRSGELATALSTTRPAMSRHLRILRQAQMVTEETLPDDARGKVYRLQPEPFAELRGWVAEVEAFWGAQLEAFGAHAERKHRGQT